MTPDTEKSEIFLGTENLGTNQQVWLVGNSGWEWKGTTLSDAREPVDPLGSNLQILGVSGTVVPVMTWHFRSPCQPVFVGRALVEARWLYATIFSPVPRSERLFSTVASQARRLGASLAICHSWVWVGVWVGVVGGGFRG